MRRPFILVALAILAACSRKPAPSNDVPAAESTPVASSPAASSAAPTMPPAGPPGWAYVLGRGIAAISPTGKVTAVKAIEESPKAVTRASDGKAYAVSSQGLKTLIHLLEEDRSRVVGSLEDCQALVGVSLDVRGNQMVLACSKKVFEGKGESFTTIDAPDESYQALVWIGVDGSTWYTTQKGTWQRKAGEWRQVPGESLGDGAEGVVQADGAAWVVALSKIVEVRETGARLAHATRGGAFALSPASNGLMVFSDGRGELSSYTTAGLVKTVQVKGKIQKGDVDDTGRVWGAADGQLRITRPDGGEMTVVPMGAYAELDKLSVSSNVAVLGSGPKEPAAREVRKTKRISGRIVLNGKPLAGAEVELCPRGNWIYSGVTPCSDVDSANVRKSVTDAKGGFSVGESPMGVYYLHYKAKGAEKWSVDSSAIEPKENLATDLGTMRYQTGN